MHRIEIDCKTGKQTVIQFTPEEEQKRLVEKLKIDKIKEDKQIADALNPLNSLAKEDIDLFVDNNITNISSVKIMLKHIVLFILNSK